MNWYFYVDTLLLSIAILIVVWMSFHKPRFHEFMWCLRWASAVSYIVAQTIWTTTYLYKGLEGLMDAKIPWVVFNVLVIMYLAVKTWRYNVDSSS